MARGKKKQKIVFPKGVHTINFAVGTPFGWRGHAVDEMQKIMTGYDLGQDCDIGFTFNFVVSKDPAIGTYDLSQVYVHKIK